MSWFLRHLTALLSLRSGISVGLWASVWVHVAALIVCGSWMLPSPGPSSPYGEQIVVKMPLRLEAPALSQAPPVQVAHSPPSPATAPRQPLVVDPPKRKTAETTAARIVPAKAAPKETPALLTAAELPLPAPPVDTGPASPALKRAPVARRTAPAISTSVVAAPPPAVARSVQQVAVEGKKPIDPPDFRGNVQPEYPAGARSLGMEGVVRLRIAVSSAGAVTEVTVVRSSGYDLLDAAAVRAVRAWRGAPARRDGRAVASSWVLPVAFRL